MFTRSAQLYDLLYQFKDYAAASADIRAHIRRWHPEAESLLDVACGTGKHLEQLSAWYDVAGLDISEELLAIARTRCPGVPLHQADMADFTLGDKFDVITCLFSSIGYVRTKERLASTLRSMKLHLRPGGVILLEPWFTPESFWTGTITANFVDEPDKKISWMYASNPPKDDLAVLDIHYLVGSPGGVDYFTERHELGLFTDEQYRRAIEGAGLAVAHDADGPFGRGLYIGFDEERSASWRTAEERDSGAR